MNETFQDFSQHQSVDYKVILFKFYRYWYFFAITIFIALISAFVFNKYAKPVYEVKTTVLIKDKSVNKQDPQNIIGLNVFRNLQNLQNEIGILNSYSLAYRTIVKCGFEVGYYREDNFITRELYKSAPFIVEFDATFPQPVGSRFNLTILSNTEFHLDVNDEKAFYFNYSTEEFAPKTNQLVFEQTYRFGQEISTEDFRFKVLLNANFNPEVDKKKAFFFVFNDYPSLAGEFNSFSIEPINREASILRLTLRGGNVPKMIDFLNALTNEYIVRGLEQKNLVAGRTISFIDNELIGIVDSLNLSERSLQSFKSNTEIMDLDATISQVFEKMMDLQDEKAALTVKSKYLNNLEAYILKNQSLDDIIVPASMGVDNPMLNDLTIQLTELYKQRNERSLYSKDKNPTLIALDLQIQTVKNALYENVKSAINTNDIALNEVNDRIGMMNEKISTLPENQRILIGIERKYQLVDAIYTFLLQKRSEAQITQASNLPDNEVVDKAPNAGTALVSPKKSLNYLISLIIGILLPIIYIL